MIEELLFLGVCLIGITAVMFFKSKSKDKVSQDIVPDLCSDQMAAEMLLDAIDSEEPYEVRSVNHRKAIDIMRKNREVRRTSKHRFKTMANVITLKRSA